MFLEGPLVETFLKIMGKILKGAWGIFAIYKISHNFFQFVK